MIPIGLETFSRPSPVTRRPSAKTISRVTIPVTSNARPTASTGPSPVPSSANPSRYVSSSTCRGRRGPTTTSSPARITVTVIGAPPEPETRRGCRRRSRARRRSRRSRSPAWRPIALAGYPGSTAATVFVAFPPAGHEEEGEEDDREQDVRRRAGRDRDEALPRRRLPVRVRAERVAKLGEPLLRRRERDAGGSFCSRTSSSKSSSAVGRRRQSSAASARFTRSYGPVSTGASSTARSKRRSASCGTGRCMPGIVTKPPSGIAPIAVLDVVPLELRDRGREADVEPPRAQADREGREEVPALVDEDEHRETEDRDGDAHAAASLPSARRRASASASTSSATSRAGAPSTPASASSTSAAISRNPMRRSRNAATATSFAALKAHGYVPPLLPRLAREPQQREALEIGRLELERERLREVERRDRSLAALGIGQRVRDRHAHVRVADVSERGAVAEADERRGRSSSGARRRRCARTAGRRESGPRSARAPCSRASPSRR